MEEATDATDAAAAAAAAAATPAVAVEGEVEAPVAAPESEPDLVPSPSPDASPATRRSRAAPDGGSESLLVMCEFVNALLRVADATFGGSCLLEPYYSLRTTHYSLRTTHYALLTTHYSLLTTHYPGDSTLTLVQRAEELLERFIVPYAQTVLQQDSFGHTLRSRRAQAVLDKYRAHLKPIFDFYAAADTTSADARESTASLNLAEVRLLT